MRQGGESWRSGCDVRRGLWNLRQTCTTGIVEGRVAENLQRALVVHGCCMKCTAQYCLLHSTVSPIQLTHRDCLAPGQSLECVSTTALHPPFFSTLFVPPRFVYMGRRCGEFTASPSILRLRWLTRKSRYMSRRGLIQQPTIAARAHASGMVWERGVLVPR